MRIGGSTRSLIAEANALFRMAEGWLPVERRALEDPYAARLGQGHPLLWAIRGLRRALPPLGRTIDQLRTAHCVRHATIDALVRASLDRGVRQIVVLGAGYDMRASRLGVPGSRWFELDRAEVLARKTRHLQGATGLHEPVTRLAVDLRDALPLGQLRDAGLDPGEPTCFVLEGLVHYLPRPRILGLLAETGAGQAPRDLILSFIQPAMVRRAPGTLLWLFRTLGEIPRTWLSPDELAELGREAGLPEFSWWALPDQIERFVPQVRGRAVGVSQDVALLQRR